MVATSRGLLRQRWKDMIIIEGEDCWHLLHTDENGYTRTRNYPKSMSKKEVKMAWMYEILSGTMLSAARWFKDDFGDE